VHPERQSRARQQQQNRAGITGTSSRKLPSMIVWIAMAGTGAVGGLASVFAARLVLGIGEGATFPTGSTGPCRRAELSHIRQPGSGCL
jgi:hypothetical protein